MMNQGFVKRLAAGLSGLLAASAFAAETGKKADPDAGDGSDLQVTVVCQFLQMPTAIARTLFGAQGALPGGDVTPEFWQRIAQSKEVEVLSAPRVTSRAGQSAQIKVGDQRSFATNFKMTAHGAWEPVFQPTDIGLTMTVVVNAYPNDPEQLRGVAEISMSKLVTVNEQQVTPPGQKDPFTLQLPVIDSRMLTTAFAVTSGKTVVLGGLDRTEGEKVTNTIVLLTATSTSPAVELIGKLKKLIVPESQFENAPLPDVVQFLVRRAQDLDPEKKGINIVLQGRTDGAPPKITLALKNVPLYETIRYIARVAGASVEYGPNAVVIVLP